MNRDDIIRMAREAGWPGIYAKPLFSITMQEDDFLRFAALAAAAEREACATVCELLAAEPITLTGKRDKAIWRIASKRCAAAIRARGEK